MLDVAIAMIPATAYGVYQFGIKAGTCDSFATVAACVLSEYVYETASWETGNDQRRKRPGNGYDPGAQHAAGIPLWIPVLGGIFAIIVVKQLYGGLGPELHEPGSGGQMFLTYCICGQDDGPSHTMTGSLHLRRNASGDLKGRPGSGYSGHVHR